MYMHGRIKKGGEDRLPQKIIPRATGFGQHMQSVPSPRISIEGKSNSLIVSTATDTSSSFSKDGRKISVGDCALFKPPHDSPPFIGVICSLSFNEDKNLQLGVTWLYRPAEVKLGKSFFLDAAPNEIFYSFHKNEKIPAASLLHPCKVAFLPKGVELPKGMSSFVCRRVYDIDKKCLWWLTDKDYIDERQDEVNKLLNRTQKEMDLIVLQAGGSSPTGTSVVSHLKSGSDNLQNSVTSSLSQIKGKKRDQNDQSREHVKRDDGDSGSLRSDSHRLRLEIAKIIENGGLVDSMSVEKLVELIRPRTDRNFDLSIRSMVSNAIAVTDTCDCLNQFVQLKGLSVLDEWLQDVNKGRLKDSDDKYIEEFLFVLLLALDKLPVNLHALQTCNIGRSVNGLRLYKNMEIQKKARSLVDKWKKRVESEMNVIDAKTGSPRAEVHEGRNLGGDVSMKSSVLQPCESMAATTTKSACSSPGSIKSASDKEIIKNKTVPNNGTGEPLSSREDKNKLIVKIPNHNCGATQSPIERSGDPSVINGLSSPVLSSDQDSKNYVPHQSNVASDIKNDHKDLQVGFDVGDRCSDDLHKSRKISEGSRSPFSLTEKDLKLKKPREPSSSAMDALIESCAKYSEESASTSPGDDIGMNLLASVATRELGPLGDGSMSKTVIEASSVLSREETKQSNEVSGGRTACSSFEEEATISKGVKNGEDYNKKVEKSTSSASGEIDSEKDASDDALDEIDAEQADKNCIGDEKTNTSKLFDDESEKKDSSVVDSKLDFDLNETLLGDDGRYEFDEQPNSGTLVEGNPMWGPASATVAAAAADGSTSKHCTLRPFDIDLNVADENVLEDITGQHCVFDLPSTSGQSKFQYNSKIEFNGFTPNPFLDLNRVDDSSFMMQYPASTSQRLPVSVSPAVPVKPLFPGSLPTNDVRRDFDLNNGPGFDAAGVTEPPALFMNSHLPFSGLRPNWLPHSNPYPSVITPMVGPQRIMSDMYRGAVLPSTTFPYQMFPFGTSLPLPPGTFSVASSSSYLYPVSANTHFLSPNNAIALQHPKPLVTGFDLNTGPGIMDVVENREDFMTQRRQLLVSGSNTGGAIKRKEPEGGLEKENFRYNKQPSSWH